MHYLVPILLLLASQTIVLPVQAQERETRQFQLNAKLAGRTLACGDRAGHATLRSASRELAALLPGDDSVQTHMQAFDKRARLQQRFTQRASNKKRACERIADEIEDNLRFTRLIVPRYPEPD